VNVLVDLVFHWTPYKSKLILLVQQSLVNQKPNLNIRDI